LKCQKKTKILGKVILGVKLQAIECKIQSQRLFFRRPTGEGCKMKTSVFLDNFRRYNNIGKVALDETVDFKHNTSSLRVGVE